MKFSILVPVYNVEKYLEQCVESLLNQTYNGKYEIILVDDGSTDSSGKICDKYAEAYPEKIRVIHKENGGHTSARLTAAKAATGEYCLFSDSDDFVENNLLETVSQALIDNPGADMVMYSFWYYENNKKLPRKNYKPDKTEIYEGENKKELYKILISTPFINSLCTKAIKAEILKNDPTNYSEIYNKDIAEDAYAISYFLTASKKIININKPLYNYRTNRKSISRSYSFHKIERKNMLFLYKRFVRLLTIWEMDNEDVRSMIYKACFSNMLYLFRKHYEYAGSIKNKKAVLEYNWDSMLFEEIIANPEKYANPNDIKLYKMIINRKELSLFFYFSKNKIYSTFKRIKKTIIRQG